MKRGVPGSGFILHIIMKGEVSDKVVLWVVLRVSLHKNMKRQVSEIVVINEVCFFISGSIVLFLAVPPAPFSFPHPLKAYLSITEKYQLQ